jgi:hypothetical protein
MVDNSAETRYDRQFGRGQTLGDNGENFFQKPIGEQVKEMAWSHACPVVDDVIQAYGEQWAKDHPQATDPQVFQGGAEMALQRYAECNFMFGYIAEVAKNLNPSLHEQLNSPVKRLPNEPDGEHGTKYVPETHKDVMSPLSTPWGYGIPRVVIEQMGRGPNNSQRTADRIQKALEIIDEVVPQCQTPIELAVKLSEAVVQKDAKAEPRMVIYHLLSAGILHEENCPSIFQQMINEMTRSAPTLLGYYESMTTKERNLLGVVDMHPTAY